MFADAESGKVSSGWGEVWGKAVWTAGGRIVVDHGHGEQTGGAGRKRMMTMMQTMKGLGRVWSEDCGVEGVQA